MAPFTRSPAVILWVFVLAGVSHGIASQEGKEKKDKADRTEKVTLYYIAGLDDLLPPKTFLAIDDKGSFSGPVRLTWDTPPKEAAQKKAFDALLKRLNENGIKTGIRVTFECRGEWLDLKTNPSLAQEPGWHFQRRLRVTSVPQLDEASKKRMKEVGL